MKRKNTAMGEWIVVNRRRAGLDQEALGELVGASRSTVQRWEAGKAPDASDIAKMIAVGFDLAELADLLRRAAEEVRAETPEIHDRKSTDFSRDGSASVNMLQDAA